MTESSLHHTAWQILNAMVSTFNGYSIDLEQIHDFMTRVEEILQQQDL